MGMRFNDGWGRLRFLVFIVKVVTWAPVDPNPRARGDAAETPRGRSNSAIITPRRAMPTSATPYPDPPAFFTLYGAPDVVPPAPPTPPTNAAYASFGANHHTAPWHDPDHGYAASGGFVYPICVDERGKTDAREEMCALTRHATARFVEAMERCVDAPTRAEEATGALHALFNNAHKLINETIRPSQAMTDFEYQIERMIEEKRTSVEALERALERAKAVKANAAEASEDLGVEALKRALEG